VADKQVLNFIDRIHNPDKYPVIMNDDGSWSTHRMAAEVDETGNWMVFPTIVQLPDGELFEFQDPYSAMEYARNTGEFVQMKDRKEALNYAKGGYKKGTPLETFNPFAGK